jgi:hypothetical protein
MKPQREAHSFLYFFLPAYLHQILVRRAGLPAGSFPWDSLTSISRTFATTCLSFKRTLFSFFYSFLS